MKSDKVREEIAKILDSECNCGQQEKHHPRIAEEISKLFPEMMSEEEIEILGDLLISLREHFSRAVEEVDKNRTYKRIVALEKALANKIPENKNKGHKCPWNKSTTCDNIGV